MIIIRLMAIGLLLLAGGGRLEPLQIPVDTSTIAGWSPITLPLVSHPTSYAAMTVDGRHAIFVESDDGASALAYDREFNIYQTPILRWSWEALNVLPNGNAETRQGDDYAVRIQVMFPYDPSRLSLLDRLRYDAARELLGYLPPSEILNYAWANRPHRREPLPNAFSARGMMFFPDAGTEHLGQWRSHRVNLLEDFRRAFGSEPQASFRIAIMGDSDNTHGQTRAFVADISLSSE